MRDNPELPGSDKWSLRTIPAMVIAGVLLLIISGFFAWVSGRSDDSEGTSASGGVETSFTTTTLAPQPEEDEPTTTQDADEHDTDSTSEAPSETAPAPADTAESDSTDGTTNAEAGPTTAGECVSIQDQTVISGVKPVPLEAVLAGDVKYENAIVSDEGQDTTYLLSGSFETLSLVAGTPIDQTESVDVSIRADGTSVWSERVDISDGTIAINLNVAGVNQLELRNSNSRSAIIWADAQLCGTNPATVGHNVACADGTSAFDLPIAAGTQLIPSQHVMANRFTPATSTISDEGQDTTYLLSGSFETLSLVAGTPIDQTESVDVSIRADGTSVWSERVDISDGTIAINLNVAGVNQLELRNSNSRSAIIWADAQLCGTNPATVGHNVACADGTSAFDLPIAAGTQLIPSQHVMANRFTPATSTISDEGQDTTYLLSGSFETLSLVAGTPIDQTESVDVSIRADGTSVWSERVDISDGTIAINLNVAGVNQLELRNSNSRSAIIWADAQLCNE